MNGEMVDSWIHSLSTYFDTSPEMDEAMKLQIAILQLEGITQTRWDTQLESLELIVELGTLSSPTSGCIASWDTFCQELREHFYPPVYLQNFLAKWLQLRQLSNQSIRGYIHVFCKLHIQLHVNEPNKVLIINFNSILLLPLQQEVDLFDIASLDKAFLHALAIKIKVDPHIRYSPYQTQADNPPSSHLQPYPSSSSMTNNVVWCNFHKTNSHNSADYRAIKNNHPHQTLFVEATPTEFP
jgi:hypothetical protein